MNLKALDDSLAAIVEKRILLAQLGYDNPDYDLEEETLEILEDDFLDNYGGYMEDIITKIHHQFCPETEVLSPIAYLARRYDKETNHQTNDTIYDVDGIQGVPIELSDFPTLESYMVLIPRPARLLLLSVAGDQEIWRLNI